MAEDAGTTGDAAGRRVNMVRRACDDNTLPLVARQWRRWFLLRSSDEEMTNVSYEFMRTLRVAPEWLAVCDPGLVTWCPVSQGRPELTFRSQFVDYGSLSLPCYSQPDAQWRLPRNIRAIQVTVYPQGLETSSSYQQTSLLC
jgi:hypothetical protein